VTAPSARLERGPPPVDENRVSTRAIRPAYRLGVALTLPKEAFVALAAVAWADGRISRGEGIGLVRAAEAAGLAGDDLEAVKRATQEKVSLDDFDASALSPFEGLVTLAIASWLARVDGVAQNVEVDQLASLGDKLGLNDFKRKTASSAAFDIACLPQGHRPEKYDFVALVAKLREKLPMVDG
jgi:hypothetical protein